MNDKKGDVKASRSPEEQRFISTCKQEPLKGFSRKVKHSGYWVENGLKGTFPYHHSNNVPSQSLFIQSIAVFSSHLLSLSVSSKSLALNYLFPLICKFYESGTWCVVFPALPEYIAECWAH